MSGLKTNFSLSRSYSFHISLYHKSLFLEPQPKLYPSFRNANPEKQWYVFWSLFIFRGHSTREPAPIVPNDEQGDQSFLWAHTGTGVSHSKHRKNSGAVLEKNAGEWTRKVEISEEEIPDSRRCMHGYIYWPIPCFKGRTFKLCALNRWDFNFCVRSSPLRAMQEGGWAYNDKRVRSGNKQLCESKIKSTVKAITASYTTR